MSNTESHKRVAFVSGSTAGIGLAVVKALLEEGYTVIGNSRKRKEELNHEFGQLLDQSPNLQYIEGDVTREDDTVSIFTKIKKYFGRIDILVNNVGATQKKPLLRISGKEFEESLRQNLMGAFYCTKQAIGIMMIHKYGRIINISSMAGVHGLAFEAGYSASKAGLIGFTKAVAKEYGNKGITCNTIAPGIIHKTDSHEEEVVRSGALSAIIVKRTGRADEVAHSVIYLASEQAGYITGETIEINGGLFI